MNVLLDILLWPFRKIGLIGPKLPPTPPDQEEDTGCSEDDIWATTDTGPRSFKNILAEVKKMEPGENRTFWFDPEDPMMDGEDSMELAIVTITMQVGSICAKYSVCTGQNRYLLNIRRDD